LELIAHLDKNFSILQYTNVMRYLNFENSTSLQLTIAQWFLFYLWRLEMKEWSRILNTIAQLQMRRAFITDFTSEKLKMTIKKFISQLAIEF
jgi:hypothetical protein